MIDEPNMTFVAFSTKYLSEHRKDQRQSVAFLQRRMEGRFIIHFALSSDFPHFAISHRRKAIVIMSQSTHQHENTLKQISRSREKKMTRSVFSVRAKGLKPEWEWVMRWQYSLTLLHHSLALRNSLMRNTSRVNSHKQSHQG